MKKSFILSICLLISSCLVFCGQAQRLSVHDMFKEVSQDELLQMMEEGQKFIENLQQHGTPEEKAAFEKSMDETLRNFTPDDWQEFQQIVDVVKDKLPEPQIDQQKPEPKQVTENKETKPAAIDADKSKVSNTIESMFIEISKLVKMVIQKMQSNKSLAEHFNNKWILKNQFNEMIRQIMVINKEDLIAKLTSKNADEETKALFESIKNFHIKLQEENKLFAIADSFGLEVDEKVTAMNIAKMNRMLSFLEQAIQSLSPKVTEFIKKYEPDALKKAEDIQAKEKKALQDEKDSQKYQEKNIAFGKTAPQQGYRPQYHPNDTYRGQPTRYQQPQYAENKPNSKKASNNEQKTASSSDIPPYPQQIPTNESKKPNNNNKESFLQATTDLTDFTKEFSDSEFKASLQTLEKLSTNYPEFTAPEGTDDDKKIEQLENFTRKLNKEIQSIFEELNALQNYAQKAQTSMSDSSEKDIEKLAHASSLSTINSRLNDYENEVERYHQTITVKNTANKGKLPAGEMQNHNDQLFQQALKLNGLAEKITQTQILFKSLDRTIKKELKRHKEAK